MIQGCNNGMNNIKRANFTRQYIIQGMLIITLSLNLIASDALAKSKKCKKYQDKYQTVLAKQRQANSNNQSNKLKEKANKTFKQWQRCKQGKRNK